jgi:hypothetical protein
MVVQENQPIQRAIVLNKITSINANMNRQQSFIAKTEQPSQSPTTSSTQVTFFDLKN